MPIKGGEFMSKTSSRNSRVILLAYTHRYVYPILAVALPMLLEKQYILLAMGIGFLLIALYDLVGYCCRWKHIYCSYQNAHHQKMTPNHILWSNVKKTDAFGSSAIFGFLGTVMIIMQFGGYPY